MLPHEPGIRLAVGIPGAGKTYSIRRDVIAAARRIPVIVVDRTWEWHREPYNRIPRDVRGCYAPTVEAAIAQIRHRGARLVIVAPRDVEHAAKVACEWAAARGKKGGPREGTDVRGVVIHEAHNAFPVSKPLASISEAVMDCATAWRHFRVAIWLDTQRLAQLNRAWDLATELRLFAATDKDRQLIAQIVDRECAAAVAEAGRRLAPRDRGGLGEPGWHVALSSVRLPPYRLVRA